MKILWFTPYTPWPLDSGGRIRLYNLVRELASMGHRIDMRVCGDARPEFPLEMPLGVNIALFRGRNARSTSGRVRSLISQLPSPAWRVLPSSAERTGLSRLDAYDVAVLEQTTMGAYGPRLDEYGIPWVVDAQNIETRVYGQLRQKVDRLRTRALLAVDEGKMERLEASLFRNARATIAMSHIDASRIAKVCPGARLVVHTNGVDSTYFRWHDHSLPRRSNIVFTASFGYGPNADAARWIVDELMPAILRRIPAATATLVGRDPPDDIVVSAGQHSRVTVTGAVEDVRPYLESADLFLAPLRCGSGTRLKALEALSSGLPVVGTTLAVEGLGLDNSDLVQIADEPEDLVAAVARGLEDLPTRRRMVYEGRKYVEREFSWAAIAQGFAETLSGVGLA